MRGFCLAFHLVVLVGASASDDSGALAGMMRPGMMLRGLIYPLNPMSPDDNQVLRAAEVEILDPSSLLRITGLRLAGGRKSGGFHLEAPTAVFDLKTKAIRVDGGFRAAGLGLNFAGAGLRAELKSRTYQIDGRFEIQPGGLPQSFPPSKRATRDRPSPFRAPVFRPDGLTAAAKMTPVVLVQDFAGDLTTFLDCWRWVEDRPPRYENRPPSTFMLMCHQGGEIDLERMEMRLIGRSAILGPRSVLVSSGGIRLCQETPEEGKFMRMTGQGGIRAWIHPPQSNETWIYSSDFGYVSDRGILQFEGGPLMVGRDGLILEAGESWQFVRVFNGGRIVLSPGSWNVVGTVAKFTD